MFTLEKDHLVLRVSEVHEDARCRIGFQRTLRIPDDNRAYPLPPGLGAFPVRHVDDYRDRLPPEWVTHGGVLLPMYQAEALWIDFDAGDSGYPFAIKIATGKISAITGAPWHNALAGGSEDQDYVVIPDQPWLDGYCVQRGLIRQFVAMPLGRGHTAEEQLTGEAIHGGIQIVAYPMKRAHYEARVQAHSWLDCQAPCQSPEMGLAPGGLMHQEVYEDPYGIDAWDTDHASRCFVHLLNSVQYERVTGRPPPTEPPSAKAYTEAGLPWFEYYGEGSAALSGTKALANMDSVAAKSVKAGEAPDPHNEPVDPKHVIGLTGTGQNAVREGEF